MADEFIYCPNCDSKDLKSAGYEDGDDNDTGELVCSDCGWEGLPEELVCAPSDEDEDDTQETA